MLPSVLQEHFDNPYHRGECPDATHSAECSDNEAGCTLLIELLANESEIVEAWFDGEGCACCEGLASLLMERAESQSIEAARALTIEQLLPAEFSADQLPTCQRLPLDTLRLALDSPIDAIDPPSGFSGPSLREEC